MVDTITAGLAWMAKQQQSNGLFFSQSVQVGGAEPGSHRTQTTFFTAQILHNLNQISASGVTSPDLDSLRQKAAHFLLAEKSPNWTWNYWSQAEPQKITHPYPDDLDDTFAALIALHGYDPSLIDGTVLAAVVQVLIATEVKPGGPYRTWLVPREAAPVWQDTDPVVNSVAGYFLAQQNIHLKPLERYGKTILQKGAYQSAYYASVYVVLYFFSRFMPHPQIKLQLERQLAADTPTIMESALAAHILLNCDASAGAVYPHIKRLQKVSEADLASFAPFCRDPTQAGQAYQAGASALTEALRLAALARYTALGTGKQPSAKASALKEEERMYRLVKQEVEAYLVRSQLSAKQMLSESYLTRANQPAIATLPCLFYHCLDQTQCGKPISEPLLVQLGLVSVYGWMAYTILDDVLDEEGETELLLAGVAIMREMVHILSGLFGQDEQFWHLVDELCARMERANHWEMTNYDLPRQKNLVQWEGVSLSEPEVSTWLADRSIGHCIGCCAVLYAGGWEVSSPEVQTVVQFFEHYLTARQLNDDAHDWPEDLQRGRLNSVSVRLLKRWRSQHVSSPLSLAQLEKALQPLFWQVTVQEIAEVILQEVEKARSLLRAASFLNSTQALEDLLAPLEQAAEQVRSEHAKATAFFHGLAKTV